MNLNIGNKIRRLRKSKNLSQEALAGLLGVSFQAVSKWETGTALPDVTLIPAIASLFGVSTDELFEYNRMEAEKKVEALCREAAALRTIDDARAASILRSGLKQFPGNDIILNNLLYVLEVPGDTDEIISICKSLIASTHDDCIKYDAVRILADTYGKTGQQALVAPTLELIPEIYFTKLEQMALLLEGDDSLNAAKAQFGLCLEQMLDMLCVLEAKLNEKEERQDAVKCRRLAERVTAVFQKQLPAVLEHGIQQIIAERETHCDTKDV